MPKARLIVCPVGSKGALSEVEVRRDVATEIHREIVQSTKQRGGGGAVITTKAAGAPKGTGGVVAHAAVHQ